MWKPEIPPEVPGLIEQVKGVWHKLTQAERQEAFQLLEEALKSPEDGWPVLYVNRETGRPYVPHTVEEDEAVHNDAPRYLLVRGGEGGGKSVAGIIKCLNRVRRGMSGIMVSPNLPHFKRSLWPEFRRWCPWDQVCIPHQRYSRQEWEPHEPFTIVFKNHAELHCAGIERPRSLEGPNINFAHFDEARLHPDEKALTVLDGRIRIPGKSGESPQMWFTTTPAMNWLYTYFGPLLCKCKVCGDVEIELANIKEMKCPKCGGLDIVVTDLYPAFKEDARDVVLLTEGNEQNTFDGFADKRGQSLTEKEKRVLLNAEWEDLTDGEPFLPSIIWWDTCKEDLPPLTQDEQVVLSLDAATGRRSTDSDCFAIVGTTRHPDPQKYGTVAVRIAETWQARPGEKIDYLGTEENPGPERFLLRLCGYRLTEYGLYHFDPNIQHNVMVVTFDPTELHDMAQRLYTHEGIVWFEEFSQGNQRLEADRQLLELIKNRRIAHNGDEKLREHIRNADRKLDSTGRHMRIVKRNESQKIDLTIALSMASYMTLHLNLL